jgi:hypothetical protein
VLFGMMFVLAGFNLLFAERRLKRGEGGWVRVLRLTIAAELALGMGLMLMSAVMAASVPARDIIAQREQASPAIMETQDAGQPEAGLSGTMTPDPADDE